LYYFGTLASDVHVKANFAKRSLKVASRGCHSLLRDDKVNKWIFVLWDREENMMCFSTGECPIAIIIKLDVESVGLHLVKLL
jgi:hypothetical protein